MKLVFATHNSNKLQEVRLLMPKKYQLLSMDDIGCTEDIPETGSTLKENALIKANYVFEHYGYPCFADDTGLLVDALNGAPGVYSARYAGDQKSAEDNIDKLLNELKSSINRDARFETVIALKMEDRTEIFIGVIKGEITREKRGEGGFGYDPVFRPDGYDLTFGEMTLEMKNQISHRALALDQLSNYFLSLP